jgi:nucleoside-diphosphate-sugar epimerase
VIAARLRIFVAGASGAIGRLLVPQLVSAGHEVTGATRSHAGAAVIAGSGSRAVVVDVLDRPALLAAVAEARPDIVIHQLTDLTTPPGQALGPVELRRNARLRVEGTGNLVAAVAAAGGRRLIAQSIAWLYADGAHPHTEDDPLLPPEPPGEIPSRLAVHELERLVTTDPRFEGVVLRYGRFYGPGTWDTTPSTPPTVHVEAAARAAVLALDHCEAGIYNVVDDAGPVSNAKARWLLGWSP